MAPPRRIEGSASVGNFQGRTHGGNEKTMKDSVRKWLLAAARKEQNPYMQAELIYAALKTGNEK
jgi:hypothetical protein